VFARDTEPALVAEGVVRLGTELVNWYLLEEDGRVTVLDAGAPAYRPQLDEGLALLGRTTADVAAIVLTHAHADHTGFAEPLRSELGVPVYVHANDEHLATTKKAVGKNERSFLPYLRHGHAWKLVGHLATAGGAPKALSEVETFQDGDALDVPGRPRVVHTPGHTTGHTCFWMESSRTLAVGDLLCTRNPLTGGRGPQLLPQAFNLSTPTMLDSLARIEHLDAATIVFGHGDPWTDGAAEAVRLARAAGPT
jgi:glyoxylase-like metal-dependent hydrolase (beta-lactamase superfamily II)